MSTVIDQLKKKHAPDDNMDGTQPMIEKISAKKYYGSLAVGTVVIVNGQPNHFTGPKQHSESENFIKNISQSSADRWMKTHGDRLHDDALAPLAMGLLEQTTKQESLKIGKAYVFHDGSAIIDDVVTGSMIIQNDYVERKQAAEKQKDPSKIRAFLEDTFGLK